MYYLHSVEAVSLVTGLFGSCPQKMILANIRWGKTYIRLEGKRKGKKAIESKDQDDRNEYISFLQSCIVGTNDSWWFYGV